MGRAYLLFFKQHYTNFFWITFQHVIFVMFFFSLLCDNKTGKITIYFDLIVMHKTP